MSDLYGAALRYAEAGMAVFPCHYVVEHDGHLSCSCGDPKCTNAGKHPYAMRAPKGLLSATTDLRQIERWWGVGTTYNVGARTGRESGVVVIDIDPRHGGPEALTALEERYGALPVTRRHLTGSLGQHILFRHPGRPIRNNAGKLGPGLDVRGDGGYIIVPPSRHISGRRYVVIDDIPLADMPVWLLRLLEDPAKPKVATSSQSWQKLISDGVTEGRRNAAVASITGLLMRPGPKTPAIVLDLMRCWNALRCVPPLSEGELVRTVQSICGRELARQEEAANVDR
jgi:hypothetical protein